MKVQLKITGLALALVLLSCGNRDKFLFRNSAVAMEKRVDDLVSRLTLEEKVAQMGSSAPEIKRLGITAFDWQNECLHGVGKLAEYKVTVYPQPIGMAASWDAASIYKMADFTAEEVRAVNRDASQKGRFGSYYGLTYWAPNINIFRDPRWGRGHETFGEDPYLTGVLGKSFVHGLQGDDPTYLKASACAKHFAVHSGPESLRHEFNTEVSTYDLWDTYLPAFRDLIVDAKATGVMCAYNAYGGRPCCGNDLLMMDILRNKWKFTGYVTSDCGAIDDFYKYHKTHSDTITAAVDAVLHGTDLDCLRDTVFKTLTKAVRTGLIDEKNIDIAVKRLFTIRFKLGLFDPASKVKYANIPLSVLESPEHKAHALKLARQSIVLLKNESNTLPLKKDLKKVAVVGPNAANKMTLLGNYYGYPSEIVSVLDGIKAKLSPQTEVFYERMTDYIALDSFVVENHNNELAYNGKSGFRMEYYDNQNFSGNAIISQENETDIIYRGETRFINGINSTAFSKRITTYFKPTETSTLTLNIDTDKRFRLFVNDSICIDALRGKAKAKGIYTRRFVKGKEYKIVVETTFKGRDGYFSFNIGKIKTPSLQEQAAKVKDADVIIFVGGISPSLEGEQNGVNCPGFEDGDRTTIGLPRIQTELMKELKKTGKPVVFVMMTGSALAVEWENENIPAIVNAWYGGQSAGTAVADVLFGDYNPAGRLPVTFYKSDKDLPQFTNYAMEGRTYRYFKGEPLYPFGYGLSYTTFNYKNLVVRDNVSTSDSLVVSVQVSNTGQRDGEEVVQLYLTHLNGFSFLPLRSLKGFKRIFLKAGETKEVQFTVDNRSLATFNQLGQLIVKAGGVRVSVGGSQPGDKSKAVGTCVEKDIEITGVENQIQF